MPSPHIETSAPYVRARVLMRVLLCLRVRSQSVLFGPTHVSRTLRYNRLYGPNERLEGAWVYVALRLLLCLQVPLGRGGKSIQYFVPSDLLALGLRPIFPAHARGNNTLFLSAAKGLFSDVFGNMLVSLAFKREPGAKRWR